MTKAIGITLYVLISLAGAYALVNLPKSEMQTCLETYRVYSCSLKPDYSAFTQGQR